MKKLGNQIMSFILVLTMVFATGTTAFAAEQNSTLYKIQQLVQKAESEREQYGEATDETAKQLQVALEALGVETGSYSGTQPVVLDDVIATRGYGQTHDLGKGWTYRVDKPSSDNAKPHVHVDNNSKNIHGVENVDGTPSHGKTLDGSKVPKDVQKKVKDSKDYKKGQKDLKKMQEAKREIHRRKLNLSVNKDLLIAAGIFVTAVGVAFVAPEFLPVLLAAV